MQRILALLLVGCTGTPNTTDDSGTTDDSADSGAIDSNSTGPSQPALLAATETSVCALSDDGLRCWGGEAQGTISLRGLDLDSPALELARGTSATCWIPESGGVSCVDDDSESTSQPLVGFLVDVAGGPDGFCAIEGDRTVSCWEPGASDPSLVPGTIGASRVRARAGTSSWALNQANGVIQEWPWGGSASTNQVVRGAEEFAGGTDHTCIRTTATEAQCWGDNDRGQLGVDPSSTPSATDDQRVNALDTGVAQIVSGTAHVCVRLTNGEAWCWGDNRSGQLGRGSTEPFSPTPALVTGLDGVVDLAAGDAFTCAALDDASVWCWGAGEEGQLGGADTSGTPLQVVTPGTP